MGRALAVALAFLVCAGAARAERLPEANVLLTVEPNGVVDVLENITITAPKAYTARQEVSMRAGELFAQPSVVVDERKLIAGRAPTVDTFRISRGERGVRISWVQPGGTKTVRVGYRLALVGTAYSDIVDLDAPLWESDWHGEVDTLTGWLRLPRRAIGRVRAWVEGTYTGGTLSRSQRDVRVRLHGIPAKRGVRLHVVFPRTVLTGTEGVEVQPGKGLAKVLAARNRQPRSTFWWWVLLGTVLVVTFAAVLGTGRSRPRPRR